MNTYIKFIIIFLSIQLTLSPSGLPLCSNILISFPTFHNCSSIPLFLKDLFTTPTIIKYIKEDLQYIFKIVLKVEVLILILILKKLYKCLFKACFSKVYYKKKLYGLLEFLLKV